MIHRFHQKLKTSFMLTGASLAIVIVLTMALFKSQFDIFEAKTLDWRYQSKVNRMQKLPGGIETIEEIVVVDIDNRSLEKLGRYQQWPRSYHAKIIDNISQDGALAIVFDVLFMEHDKDSTIDRSLIESTKKAMNVVHAFSFSSADPDAFLYKMETAPERLDTLKFSFDAYNGKFKKFPSYDRLDGQIIPLYNSAARIGFVNFEPDADGVIRRMPLFGNFAGRFYPGLAMATLSHLMNVTQETISIDPGKSITLEIPDHRTVEIPIDERGNMFINYKGPYKTFRYIPYYDVLEKRFQPGQFKNKIVLIGSSAAGLSDLRPVPVQGVMFPGVEINANVICNILTGDFIKQLPVWQMLLALLISVLIVSVIASLMRMMYSLPLTIAVSGLLIYISFTIFSNSNVWMELVRPMVGTWVSFLAVIVYRYQNEQKEKRYIKNVFQFYMSATVVNEILRKPDMLALGGDRKIATAFFSDIKNFTTISEQMDAQELVALLNEYFSVMSEIVLKHEGYLNKYQGDAIVALYGIPIEQEDHALRACYTALDMQSELRQLHERWRNKNLPSFEIRMGINSGPMVVGNIGGKDRFDYTAIGDSVNLASRLESANKMYGTDIIISQDTFRLVNEKLWVRELDFIRVKGKNKPVRIYEVLGRKSEKLNPIRSSSLEYFVQGLELYRQRNWVAAYDWFQKALQLVPHDGPALEFIRRCKIFIENPRPEDWDGVFNLRSK
ncbi:CHASE2 domain-containing protein [candidate division KSB1 bacterium]|nr:CHASE2 domain-containing protein [candidate division KSB1 bacterium]